MDHRQQWTRQKHSQEWPTETVFQHVHLYTGEHIPSTGARNFRRQRVPYDQPKSVKYRPNVAIVGLLVFFIMTTITAVTVLLLRELNRNYPEVHVKVKVSPEALMSAYPGMFRTVDEKTEDLNTEQKLEGLKPVRQFVSIGSTCSVSCDSSTATSSIRDVPNVNTQPPFTLHSNTLRDQMIKSNITGVSRPPRIRDKRSSYPDDSLYHGCCVSNFYHISPKTLRTIEGHSRTLIQLTNTRQLFQVENCSQAIGCDGCTCMTQQVLTTAVVLKTDLEYTAKTTMDDLEIQMFYFDGCCKCLNVGSKN
ncbi:uncharacterized protein LOC132563644 [Ylistrum balloti]|uniref:uncharacterized protein LOC132563644 n=1 Tax=Ylistrum balloti TaxID=509963 RepID=UPI002905B29C|nr:uncharacterized protein LOC132563644 [Ylistrum balloti]